MSGGAKGNEGRSGGGAGFSGGEREGRTERKCPEGHVLPHRYGTRRCSKVWCAVLKGKDLDGRTRNVQRRAEKKIREKAEREVAAQNNPDLLFVPDSDGSVTDYSGTLNLAEKAYLARKKLLQTPDLKGNEAVQWSGEELTAMLPDAVNTVKEALRFGDEAMRYKAATQVLAINGFSPKDAANSVQPPVIVLQMGGVPWSTQPQVQVVEGKVTRELLEGAPGAQVKR